MIAENESGILARALSLEDYTTELRRQFHRHPECIPAEQLQTMAAVEHELDLLQIRHVRVPGGGIFGFIDGCCPGQTLLMRADLDALPVREEPVNLAGPRVCISEIPGVMHACGHDAHMAMLLTAARMLKERAAQISGRIVLMFEEGEEGGGNIFTLLRWIDEQKLHIDSAYACHVRWDIDSGLIGVSDGAAMCGLYQFVIRIHGKTAHGSRPDQGANVIDCFAQACVALQGIRMTAVKPDTCLSYSICKVEAGHTHNVIPDELTARGTIRFTDPESVQRFLERMTQVVEGAAAMTGCTAQVDLVERHNPVRSDPAHQELLREAAEQAVGPDRVIRPELWMASESFSHITDLYPSAFAFVGIRNEQLGSGAGHHTAKFDVDEHALPYGVAAAVSYALACLKETDAPKGFVPAAPSIPEYISRIRL